MELVNDPNKFQAVIRLYTVIWIYEQVKRKKIATILLTKLRELYVRN
jgi:hypothetical protein